MKTGWRFYSELFYPSMRRGLFISFLLIILSFKVTASNYYWVGGSGNWDDLNHWATTSGGTTLYTQIPTATDDVFFDAGSGFTSASKTVTLNVATAFCHDMNWTGALNNPVLAGVDPNTLKIYGSLTFIAAMSFPFSGRVNFEATNPGNTITTAGKPFQGYMAIEGAGGGWTLQDGFTAMQDFSFERGSLNTNGQTINCQWFYTSLGYPRTLTLGSSVINCASAWYGNHSNLVFNAGTSTINMTGLNPNFEMSNTASETYYNVNFTNAGSTFFTEGIRDHPGTVQFHDVTMAGNLAINGINSFNSLTFSAGKTYQLQSGKTQTIITALNASSTCAGMINIQSSLTNSQATIMKSSGSITVDYVSLKDINATGGAVFTANHTIDLGNNTGWTINSPAVQNLYWVGGSGNWSDQSHWSFSSGGAGGACIPTPNDNVVFNAGSGFTAASKTVTIDAVTAFCHDMNWTGALSNPVFVGNAPSSLKIYGSLVFITGMSFSFSGRVYFESAALGNTITTGGQFFAGATFEGSGGGWTLLDAFTANQDFSFERGSLNTNGQTVNCSWFYTSLGFPRTLTLGSSVINCVSAWYGNHSNLVFNAGTSTINMTGLDPIFDMSNSVSETYYNVSFIHPASTTFSQGIKNHPGTVQFHDVTMAGNLAINGINSFNSLTFSAGKTYQLQSGKTQTIITALNASSTCAGMINIQSSLTNSQATIMKSSGSITVDYVSLKDINATGGAVFTANHAIDLGNNTGWTINSPATQNLYWVGSTGNWNDQAHWSFSSGGAGGACIPTPYDNVFFDANSGFTAASKTVTIDAATASCRNMSWTGALNNPVLTGSAPNILKIYGSLTFITAMSFSFTGRVYFESTAFGNTVTTAGQLFSNAAVFEGSGGGWTLQDAFTTSQDFAFERGSLNTNGQTINCSWFYTSLGFPRTLTLGSSVINCVSAWYGNHSNMVFNAGTSTINMTGLNPNFEMSNTASETYYNVNFTNAGSTFFTEGIRDHPGTVQFHDVTMAGNLAINGLNSFNNLTFAAGKTYQLQSGKTQTILDHWYIQGSCTSYILLQSSLAGSFATVTKTNGQVPGFNLHIRDIHCAGGATFNAYNSIDLGGNTGWIFSALPPLGPPAVITGPSPVCAGATGVVYHTAPIPGAIYYTWTVPSGATITSGQGDTLIVVDFGTAVSGNISVLTFNGCNYSSTGSLFAVVLATQLTPSVVLTASPTGPICAGTSVTFTATASNTGSSSVAYDFKLNGTSVQNSASNIYTTTVLANGDNVTCTITISGGACYTSTTAVSNTITANITSGTTPTVSIVASPSGPVCSGTSVTFTATAATNGTGTVAYDFKVNGTSVQNGASNIYTTTALANGDKVTCTITISGGTCYTSTTTVSNTITANITLGTTPTVSIVASPPGPICSGVSVTFTATAATNGTGTITYDFKVNGASVQNGASNVYTTTTLANTDNVTCSISISGGICYASSTAISNTIPITVTPGFTPAVSIAANPTGPICVGTSVTFTATSSTNGTGTTTYNFKVNGVSVQNSTSNTYLSSTLSNGDIVNCSIAISGGQCFLTITAVSNAIVMNIITGGVATISITTNPTGPICGGTAVTFTAHPVNAVSPISYQWQINGINAGTNSPTYSSNSLNDADQVNCIMSTSNSCAVTTNVTSNTIVMAVVPKPVISFYPGDPTIIIGDEIHLTASSNVNVTSYLWTPSTGLSNTSIQDPIARPLTTTVYHLRITAAANCTADSNITVKVLDGIYIPNAFVPSGVNNIFRIPPGTAIKNLQYFAIYNRYGNLVFRTNDINAGWDGTYKGKPANQGAYTYMIRAADALGPMTLKGTVILIR